MFCTLPWMVKKQIMTNIYDYLINQGLYKIINISHIHNLSKYHISRYVYTLLNITTLPLPHVLVMYR